MDAPADLVKLFNGANGLEWFFSPSEQRYYSFYSGELNSRVRGVNLPDPNSLFKARCIETDISMDAAQAQTIKPTIDCYLLWDDWKART